MAMCKILLNSVAVNNVYCFTAENTSQCNKKHFNSCISLDAADTSLGLWETCGEVPYLARSPNIFERVFCEWAPEQLKAP